MKACVRKWDSIEASIHIDVLCSRHLSFVFDAFLAATNDNILRRAATNTHRKRA